MIPIIFMMVPEIKVIDEFEYHRYQDNHLQKQ